MAQVAREDVAVPQEILINRETGRSVLVLKNVSPLDYAFKVKTTHPKSFHVRPYIGVIEGGEEATIEIELIGKVESLSQYRFLVQLVVGPRSFIRDNLQRLFMLSGIEKIERRVTLRYLCEDQKQLETKELSETPEKSLFSLLVIIFILYYFISFLWKMLIGN